nr:MAG TPA: hypothetical protein [Caudoviricetes sp.]
MPAPIFWSKLAGDVGVFRVYPIKTGITAYTSLNFLGKLTCTACCFPPFP